MLKRGAVILVPMAVISDVRVYVRQFGVAYFAAGLARRGAQHARYAWARLTRRRPTFEYSGHELEQFWHPYNRTWLSERVLEIPVAMWFVEQFPPDAAGLEVGNVLSHYGVTGHRVVDKYEVADGVENIDVLDLRAEEPLDWVVAISTLEHVGWDEPEQDVDKAVRALTHLRSLVRPGGRVLLTVPLGHNPGMDRYLLSSENDAERGAIFVRDARDHWTQVERVDPSEQRYSYELRSGACVWIGEFDGRREL